MKLYPGEIVSAGYNLGIVVTGVVVQRERKRDGAPFLMIEFTSGPRTGDRTFPDAMWKLSTGELETNCRQCYRPFRFNPGDDDILCPRCAGNDDARARRRSSDPDRPRTSYEQKQLRRGAREELVTT